MDLGISYNFFNGEEHLLASLRSVRSEARHISVVFQSISNAGLPASADAAQVLQEARAQGLADEIHEFTPRLDRPRQENELQKRQIGLKIARRHRCSHFLSMDADEFYRTADLKAAKAEIVRQGYTLTTVRSFFHLTRPVYRALDSTNVPFICRLNWLTRIGAKSYPAGMVDPTRRTWTSPSRHHLFEPAAVAMYHMNFVRRDMAGKLANTSTTDTEFLDRIGRAVGGWRYPAQFEFPGKGRFVMTPVENEFATFDPGTADPGAAG